MTTELTPEQMAELLPLRRVILDELVKPVQLTAPGLDDLSARLTVAVARYMGSVVPTSPAQARRLADAMEGTIYGVRPHLPAAPDKDAKMRRTEKPVPVCHTCLTPDPHLHQVDGQNQCRAHAQMISDLLDVGPARRQKRCHVTGDHGIHVFLVRTPYPGQGWELRECTGRGETDDHRSCRPENCSVAAALPSCPGCGAVVTETKHGRATLHVAGCKRAENGS